MVVLIVRVIAKVGVSVQLLWVPLLLLLLSGAGRSGLTLLLSAANLFFRDVKYIVEIVLMFAIFFTPVFYRSRRMFGRWANDCSC